MVSVTQSGFATGSNRFIRKSNQSNFSIVPILLNKEVWTKLGSCYKVQGGAGMILSPVPCYGGARPLHNVWTQYTAAWRGSVIITMVLLWWGVVVCRHFRKYQTCKLYLTMYGMRAIIGNAFTSYLGLFILECFFCPFQKNVCLNKLPPLSIQIRNLDVCMLYFVV